MSVSSRVGGSTPSFTYTGTYTFLQDTASNWRIKFLTDGTFTPLSDMVIDLFAVGGGGGTEHSSGSYADPGGGGGYGASGGAGGGGDYWNDGAPNTGGGGGGARAGGSGIVIIRNAR